jgi:hypothetical protein
MARGGVIYPLLKAMASCFIRRCVNQFLILVLLSVHRQTPCVSKSIAVRATKPCPFISLDNRFAFSDLREIGRSPMQSDKFWRYLWALIDKKVGFRLRSTQLFQII